MTRDIKTVVSRDGKVTGKVVGGPTPCPLEGCTGVRMRVAWPDGKRTVPCTKGMEPTGQEGEWRIC